jgi:hypothetical protein
MSYTQFKNIVYSKIESLIVEKIDSLLFEEYDEDDMTDDIFDKRTLIQAVKGVDLRQAITKLAKKMDVTLGKTSKPNYDTAVAHKLNHVFAYGKMDKLKGKGFHGYLIVESGTVKTDKGNSYIGAVNALYFDGEKMNLVVDKIFENENSLKMFSDIEKYYNGMDKYYD